MGLWHPTARPLATLDVTDTDEWLMAVAAHEILAGR
ncbi:hypothetical protein QFZ32_001514 [Streptomyces canus]|uniref:Uncharacterized protein n=1 Tax=Streptomyces canus TaxID=58343 RepID=A0AAW8FBC7_9ACTN|nr:hypothetical protein [Streptomyces canus]MDQ1066074.1 hypothetical protein [Streptomyces canus]